MSLSMAFWRGLGVQHWCSDRTCRREAPTYDAVSTITSLHQFVTSARRVASPLNADQRRPARRRYRRRPSARGCGRACSFPCQPEADRRCAGPRPCCSRCCGWPILGQHAVRRRPARPAAGLGRADRRPGADRHAGVRCGPRARPAPAHRPVPACRLDPPARQPGVPADLRPAGRTGDGAVAVPAAVPARRRGRQPGRGAG